MRRALPIALLLIGSCRNTPRSPDTVAGDTTPVSSDTSARAMSDTVAREIYIDSVRPTNPIVVFGRARTFENTVQLRVRDADGHLLGESFTTSAGEMGHHNPYSAELWIARDPGARVTVDVFEYSANDGSVRSLVSREVPYPLETMRLTLEFPVGDDCVTTRPFVREVPKSVAVARLLTESLVGGVLPAEQQAGASSAFPRGARVNGAVLRDGMLTVDFNERLQNVGGSCAASAIRQSVTRTLMRLPAVKTVTITAGGSEKLALQP